MAQDYGKLINLNRLELYDDLLKQELANHIATHGTNSVYGHVKVDNGVSASSDNPVSSSAIYQELAGKASTNHEHSDLYYDKDTIDDMFDEITEADATRVVLAAHELADPRNFSITGGGLAAPVTFDGTANVALNLQAVNCDIMMQDGGEWLVLDGSLTGYTQETN